MLVEVILEYRESIISSFPPPNALGQFGIENVDFSESVIFDPKSTFPILKTIFSLIKVGKLLQTYSQSIFLPLGRFWDAYSGIWDRKSAFPNLRL